VYYAQLFVNPGGEWGIQLSTLVLPAFVSKEPSSATLSLEKDGIILEPRPRMLLKSMMKEYDYLSKVTVMVEKRYVGPILLSNAMAFTLLTS
jgi:hypothetical protein